MVVHTDLLFAYGTLMPDIASAMGTAERLRLKREGRALGKAMMAGLLVDLGRYPGLLEPRAWSATAVARGTVVHGVLLQLADPEATFAWLDRYEGIEPGSSARCEYRRDVVSAVLSSKPLRAMPAHVYVYQGHTAMARALPGGRWEPVTSG